MCLATSLKALRLISRNAIILRASSDATSIWHVKFSASEYLCYNSKRWNTNHTTFLVYVFCLSRLSCAARYEIITSIAMETVKLKQIKCKGNNYKAAQVNARISFRHQYFELIYQTICDTLVVLNGGLGELYWCSDRLVMTRKLHRSPPCFTPEY